MIHNCEGTIKIFTCNANVELAKEIAKKLGVGLGASVVSRFSDGEISVKVNETVRGSDVFIIQPTSPPVNEHLMELLIMIDAFRRASAGRITAVVPYYGYARQDRKARARDPISAKLVADIMTKAGADRVLTMDLHCAQIQGFFDIPVDHLKGVPIFAREFAKMFPDLSETIVVSPDLGSVSRARALGDKLEVPLAIVDKRRPKDNVSEIMNIIGNIKDKRAILVDDMTDTAGSLVNAAEALMQNGAKEVYACCTHAILSGPAIERIKNSSIRELLILNTIPLSEEKRIDKIRTISVASIFADAINCIHENSPVSKLFD